MAGTRLPQDEYDKRVKKCYELRFLNQTPFGVKDWLDYCKEHFPDKSQQQHTKMWADAGNLYQDHWKDKLNKQLDPAINALIELLASDNEKIRQRAVDQILRYTGHDVDKQEIKQEVTYYKAQFGSDD